MKDSLVIGSRGSKLALWQAQWVQSHLSALRPEANVRIEIVKTSGDIMHDAPLAIIGGQGAFTKELEQALLDRRIHIAVHSLKDLPTIIPAGLALTAVMEREDARDALVMPEGVAGGSIMSLVEGARVGTSSLRRRAQLKSLRPDLFLKDLRGNVDTRLRKLDVGEFDAIVLASAGLRRLGLAHRISAPVPVRELVPAVAQGALGIETRMDDEDTNRLVAQLDHAPTHAACTAERALLRQLGGGCQVPIAAHAAVRGDVLSVEGLVAALSGEEVLRETSEGLVTDAERLGEELAARLMEWGAARLLADSVVTV
jgi:hydroxymethylbilane synthase